MVTPAVFVSYSHAHKTEVRNLVKYLEIGESPVFFDDCIVPGDDWERRLLNAISDAPKFVIFWCSHAAASSWIHRELDEAIQLGKRIIPVRLDNTTPPSSLAKYQWLEIRLCGRSSFGDFVSDIWGILTGPTISSLGPVPVGYSGIDGDIEYLAKELAEYVRNGEP